MGRCGLRVHRSEELVWVQRKSSSRGLPHWTQTHSYVLWTLETSSEFLFVVFLFMVSCVWQRQAKSNNSFAKLVKTGSLLGSWLCYFLELLLLVWLSYSCYCSWVSGFCWFFMWLNGFSRRISYETWVQIRVWMQVRMQVWDSAVFEKIGCGCGGIYLLINY